MRKNKRNATKPRNYSYLMIDECKQWSNRHQRTNYYADAFVSLLECLESLHQIEIKEERHIDMTSQFKARDDIITKILEYRKFANNTIEA